MRIVIDMQGTQSTGSRNRGIGRYSLSITKSIIENKKDHEVMVVLSSLFLETVELVRNDLKDYIDEEDIYVWNAPTNVSHLDINSNIRRKNSEFIRETFIGSLKPDIVFITSLFEGLGDDAVTSIGLMKYSIPTAVVLYDLIPLINSSPYLDNPDVKKWYEEKIEHLKRADLLLSISESSRQEGLEYLKFLSDRVVNIGTATDSQFKKITIDNNKKDQVLKKYSLSKEFLMYTGGIDHRKNIEGLIRSYALLESSIRAKHQLAIVCSINDEQRVVLNSLAKSVGLKEKEVIFTGYILEDDLILLYNLCKAFIFPSWHEGFGLPALEAMNCDVPVIASDRSSLPEVIGLEDALFDSLDDVVMSKKIKQVLTDEPFRTKLLKHGKEQIKNFSWNITAKKVIKAFEAFVAKNKEKILEKPKKKLKLAYLSPLPLQKTGISYYSAELLPFLSEYYDIDVIVVEKDILDNWNNEHYLVHDIDWFKANASSYDRILYHFGNSHFHKHMFSLLKEYSGTVVLHDFYLAHVIDSMGILQSELYYSHGYKPFIDKSSNLVWNYPVNKRVLDHAKGIIVHSNNSKKLADKWYGFGFSQDWKTIPHLRVSSQLENKNKLKKELSIPENSFIICSFGLLGQTKQNQKLLEAWFVSSLSDDKNAYLIFVGENDAGEYGKNLENIIKKSGKSSQIKITGWVDIQDFKKYLNIADIGVQLRTMSRGETSGTVLDCMNYGLATIVNANGSMADLNDNGVYKLEDEFTQQELVYALENLYVDTNKRKILGENAKDIIVQKHAPDKCAVKYFDSIENFYSKIINENDGLIDKIVNNSISSNENDLKKLSDSIAKNHQYSGEKQLFIDVSQLVTVDSKSGIQRVVKSILNELLINPPKGYRIEPVYSTIEMIGYKYAKKFTYDFLSTKYNTIEDSIIDYRKGDIFLGLDLAQPVVISKSEYYKTLRANGVKVYFVVYDLLPILMEKYFPKEGMFKEAHTNWLKVVCQSNGAICISNSVKNELLEWIEHNEVNMNKSFNSKYFHLGADIDSSISSKGLDSKSKTVLNQISSNIAFTMVGTIEPRKGHGKMLEVFEKLWEDNININLIIIGNEGWLVDELISKINTHSELNKKLFWLQNISDEYLRNIYKSSTSLIFASESEGFGLPLIEAAQYKLPIIARDIPVFREVAGEFAYYFKNDTNANVIMEAINNWLQLYKEDKHPKSDKMPWLTWKESSNQFLNCLEINQK